MFRCVFVVSCGCLSFVVVVRGVFVVVVVVRVGGVVVGLDHLAPVLRTPFRGTPSGGPPSTGPPKFSRFFSVSRHQFRSFCLSLCLLVEFWRFLCTFGLSGCGVKPRRLWGRRGFTRQLENSKRAHLTAPALPNTTNKPREDTQRETKKSEIGGGRSGGRKKNRTHTMQELAKQELDGNSTQDAYNAGVGKT